jgi:photosystem II stability/assembly factor-like uncharacterized protein
MKYFLIILASAFSVGCHSRATDSLRSQVEQSSPQVSVKTINSTLQRNENPVLSQWVSQRLRTSNSLIRVQILNTSQGWSATSEGILFTMKPDQSWREIRTVPMPKFAYLTDLFFLDASTGWISLSRSELHFDESTKQGDYDIAAWIMNTTDQGRTWKQSDSFEGAQILQVLFLNDSEGWAVGRRLSTSAHETDSNFVVHTTDQGKSWNDISDKLPTDTGIYKVALRSSGNVVVITGKGVLYSTTDGGMNWRRIGAYSDEHDQVAVHRLDMNKHHRLCIVGGTGGLEGTLSVLACEDANNSWIRHVLGGVFVNDAVFLADGKILACGFIAKENDPIGVGGEAAILVSEDEGKSWSVVYRNADVKSLNALAATDPHNIWAVGAKGLIVRLGSSIGKR